MGTVASPQLLVAGFNGTSKIMGCHPGFIGVKSFHPQRSLLPGVVSKTLRAKFSRSQCTFWSVYYFGFCSRHNTSRLDPCHTQRAPTLKSASRAPQCVTVKAGLLVTHKLVERSHHNWWRPQLLSVFTLLTKTVAAFASFKIVVVATVQSFAASL